MYLTLQSIYTDCVQQNQSEFKTTTQSGYPVNGLLFFLRDVNIRCFLWQLHASHAWNLSTGLAATSGSRRQWLSYRLIQHLDKPILILRNYLHTRMQSRNG